ncbi:MAG: RluA family pseudouridine synthase [Lachnospiraceae bacterium]|nr:RluA family pseudouridine synthase [Lachnospiraceae bacterium]
MKEYRVEAADDGQTLKKYVAKVLPKAPNSVIYKALRKKNIDLNGKKADGSEKLKTGDRVSIWFSDEVFQKFEKPNPQAGKAEESAKKPSKQEYSAFKRSIIFEDDNIIVMNKPAGLLSQGDSSGDVSLNDLLLSYFEENSKSNSKAFKPGIVNRLDRNTSGLVLGGLSHKGLEELSQLIKDRRLTKIYRCIVFGEVKKGDRLKGFMLRDEEANKVEILSSLPDGVIHKKAAEMEIETEYKPLSHISHDGVVMTELEVNLITGRHHQIRGHLASIGHPVMGDVKYGTAESMEASKKLNIGRQLLHAYSIAFPALKGALGSLSKKEFKAALPEDMNQLLKYR